MTRTLSEDDAENQDPGRPARISGRKKADRSHFPETERVKVEKLVPRLFLPMYRQKSALYTEYLLKMLSFEKSPLLFLFESHVRLIYTTMVLDADKEGATVLLDALHPDMGNSHLVPGTKVVFFGKLKGIDTGFRATILGQKTVSAERAVLLSFPFETYYLQRRSSLRVPLPVDLPLICLRKTNGLMGEVRPVDLGGGGLRVLLPEEKPNGDLNETFDVGDLVLIEMLAVEEFLLPPLTGRVVHREHAGRDAGGDLQSLGISFVDFPSAYEEPLLSYVSKKDREMLKNLRFEPGR